MLPRSKNPDEVRVAPPCGQFVKGRKQDDQVAADLSFKAAGQASPALKDRAQARFFCFQLTGGCHLEAVTAIERESQSAFQNDVWMRPLTGFLNQ